MNTETHKPPSALEQLADLTQTLEKEKVQLTPEVEEYVREHIRAVQNKLQAGQDVYESDLAFIPKVKMWVLMPKEWREKYPSVEDMEKSEEFEEIKEANKRHISPKQWLDLVHVAKSAGEPKEWIDETFIFPGVGKIGTKGDLDLEGCTGLTMLPDNLSVDGSLILAVCTGLTKLPDNLSVSGNLFLVGCTDITMLPDNLSVSGYLFLNRCTGLTRLPEGLKVGWDLDLSGCTGLTGLPERLKVDGRLWLSEDLNEQVIKDAEKLKREGKIEKEIIYR